MLRLILMRHAKSDWDHVGLSDHARPLNNRGQNSARALGDWIRAKDYVPDNVLCSTAERTVQTLSGLQLPSTTRTEFVSALYHAEATTMLEVLNNARGSCVLMLGHNPGICEMAHRLVDDTPLHDRFHDYPTGATLVCEFDATQWAEIDWFQADVLDFVMPRELMADT
jgi:phosphohistidine phosphatase